MAYKSPTGLSITFPPFGSEDYKIALRGLSAGQRGLTEEEGHRPALLPYSETWDTFFNVGRMMREAQGVIDAGRRRGDAPRDVRRRLAAERKAKRAERARLW